MGRVEDFFSLHAERGQVVDVKEPAVVDLVRGDFPKGEAVAPPVFSSSSRASKLSRVCRIPVDLLEIAVDDMFEARLCGISPRRRALMVAGGNFDTP